MRTGHDPFGTSVQLRTGAMAEGALFGSDERERCAPVMAAAAALHRRKRQSGGAVLKVAAGARLRRPVIVVVTEAIVRRPRPSRAIPRFRFGGGHVARRAVVKRNRGPLWKLLWHALDHVTPRADRMAKLRRLRLQPRLIGVAVLARNTRLLMLGVWNFGRAWQAPLAVGHGGQPQRIGAKRIIS